jgi:hypothetical protein
MGKQRSGKTAQQKSNPQCQSLAHNETHLQVAFDGCLCNKI